MLMLWSVYEAKGSKANYIRFVDLFLGLGVRWGSPNIVLPRQAHDGVVAASDNWTVLLPPRQEHDVVVAVAQYIRRSGTTATRTCHRCCGHKKMHVDESIARQELVSIIMDNMVYVTSTDYSMISCSISNGRTSPIHRKVHLSSWTYSDLFISIYDFRWP